MTDRQLAFVAAYVATGNAAEAARRAGYSPKCANRIGHRLLTDVDIQREIAELQKRLASERLATAREAMEFLTSIMRGELLDKNGQPVAISDRIRAASEIIKRHGWQEDALELPVIVDESSDE